MPHAFGIDPSLGLLKGKHSNSDRSPNVVSSSTALRVGIDRSYDIAIPQPEINMDGVFGIVGVCPKTVWIRLASGKFGGGVGNENCGGYAHVGLWDGWVYLILGRGCRG